MGGGGGVVREEPCCLVSIMQGSCDFAVVKFRHTDTSLQFMVVLLDINLRRRLIFSFEQTLSVRPSGLLNDFGLADLLTTI